MSAVGVSANLTSDEIGLGTHFPGIDADLYVPALLEGLLGSKSFMAARLGAAGGWPHKTNVK